MKKNYPITLPNTTAFILLIIIATFLCADIILNLTPPISRDALIHHLAIPKLWLKHEGFYEIPWADYSYYPMFINLLYLVCLYFKNDMAPKFIHLGFGIGTGVLIFFYLKKKFDRNWGLLGMVIFITTPIVVWLSTSAYVDLGMTFFTTASVLSFLKWSESGYGQQKWFFISSCCMGMGIGSKYNALIAWFILTLMLMLIYVRDTHRQIAAIRYGTLFFGVSLLVALPWYLKNYLQTGNPFYPLFNSFFNSLKQHPAAEVLYRQAMEKTGQISFFKMREVMYGETFWETLSIPIRMFFQGKDNSYQYFQGVLNPILIVFSPFISLDKKNKRDIILFALFSVLFIFMAFFLTEKQVRYILPVLPFLTILAVMGIKGLTDTLNAETFLASLRSHKRVKFILKIALFACISIFLALNVIYLRNRVHIIKPLPYVLGKETREAFLRRHLLHYDAVEYINNNLPTDARILTIFLGRRGYYMERVYINEASFGRSALKHMVDSSVSEEEFKKTFGSLSVTHILMRTDLVDKYLQDNFTPEEIERFLKQFKKCSKRIYNHNGYDVWDVQLCR